MGHGGSSSCLWGVSAGLGGEGWPAALGDSTACVADGGGRCAGAGLRALLEGRSSGLLPTPLSLRFSSVGIQGRARRDRGAAREGWQQGWGRSSSQCSCGKQTAEGQWGGFGCCQQPDGGASDGHGMRWLGQHTQRGAPRTGGEGLAGTPWQGGVGQTPSQVWGGTWARVAFFCREWGHFCTSPSTAQEAEGAQRDQDPALPLTAPWGTWQRRTSSSSPPCPTWLPRSCASHPLPRGVPAGGTGPGMRVWQPCPVPPPAQSTQLGDTAVPSQSPCPSAVCPCTRSWLGGGKQRPDLHREIWIHVDTPLLKAWPSCIHVPEGSIIPEKIL